MNRTLSAFVLVTACVASALPAKALWGQKGLFSPTKGDTIPFAPGNVSCRLLLWGDVGEWSGMRIDKIDVGDGSVSYAFHGEVGDVSHRAYHRVSDNRYIVAYPSVDEEEEYWQLLDVEENRYLEFRFGTERIEELARKYNVTVSYVLAEPVIEGELENQRKLAQELATLAPEEGRLLVECKP